MPRMIGKRVLSSVYLDPPAYEALQALAGRTRVSIAAYLREAVDDLLTKYKAKPKAAARAKPSK